LDILAKVAAKASAPSSLTKLIWRIRPSAFDGSSAEARVLTNAAARTLFMVANNFAMVEVNLSLKFEV
jgi:hypothetical protein